MIWEEGTDLKLSKAYVKMPESNEANAKKLPILVRCGWLKIPIELPNKIILCEGFRDSVEQPEN